ncbi:GatB/YqeY domain-containing protein [Cucurbitaria berberidis CBS 394.84]|uniref:Altered inheritance of mitochondria protein 41 n=1 Tax=Cucurbitaria berberidis CBS 394.84 TaxID=1168544 RepID=A0A9P4GDP3_9PLEO|nr:GatB/YqeY domain-containing protein [Cucurbitaria berberidis CBS 394.84]KAF1843431.1 GatB/YqeY domain-containing protein [Cucurbitaria berberidis CBS 394.84]
MSLFRPMLLRPNLLSSSRPLCLRTALRFSSTSASEATVLPRLQSDLKNAMRAKNKPALNTIRALQAEIINASKTAKPISTDGAFYSLVQKQIKAANTAIAEFQAAKRDDLVDKEQQQLNVLQKYADEIPKLAESEVDVIIEQAIAGLEEGKATFGSVMGKVMGAIKGRPHDVEYVTKKIQETVGNK